MMATIVIVPSLAKEVEVSEVEVSTDTDRFFSNRENKYYNNKLTIVTDRIHAKIQSICYRDE